jgi:chorismate dehydratase
MKKTKISVTAVSYLNTKPLLYGIFKEGLEEDLAIDLAIPSVCASQLQNGSAQIGLIPVAAIPAIPNAKIFSNYCIGAVGAVETVAIFSSVPLAEITHLYLDFHSRTSVQLAQILLREYWQLSPVLLPASEGFIDKITGTTAAVVIGDRTFSLLKTYPYIYDLAQAWYEWKGLPFVFAAWVTTIDLSDAFIERFNRALAMGILHIPQLVKLIPPPPNCDLEEYFTRHISYDFTTEKQTALQLFLSYL